MTRKMNILYRSLTKKEEEQAIIKILEVLLDRSVPYSGKHRKQAWEKGWKENLESGNAVPRYFGKYPINRLNGKFVVGMDREYERKMLYTIVDKYAKKYLIKHKDVYEFGCGTGHNLWRIKTLNRGIKLHGFDWAKSSNRILEAMGFHSENFDFFKPNKKLKLTPDSAVYTVAALEQTGTNYKKFVQYLLKNKPAVVVNIEPIPELLDSTKLIDYLSIQYMHKRKYLRGYLEYLMELEKKGKIKILEAKRSGIGSFLIDGYSIIVWKPL